MLWQTVQSNAACSTAVVSAAAPPCVKWTFSQSDVPASTRVFVPWLLLSGEPRLWSLCCLHQLASICFRPSDALRHGILPCGACPGSTGILREAVQRSHGTRQQQRQHNSGFWLKFCAPPDASTSACTWSAAPAHRHVNACFATSMRHTLSNRSPDRCPCLLSGPPSSAMFRVAS